MSVRQELLTAIEQLPDEQLSVLLDLALSLKEKDFVQPVGKSGVSDNGKSTDNNLCNEVFFDPKYKEHHLDRRAFLNLPVAQRNVLLSHQATTVEEHFQPGVEAMEWVDKYIEDQIWDDD